MNHLLPFLHGGVYYVGVFLVVLTVLVFVHELGHYLIARCNGVRIEVFSIGFGPELFGWHDRAGTRWKFSAIPLGGYVKMFGDADASSGLQAPNINQLTAAEREVSFHCKRLGQRAAIVAAGPIANFVFAIVMLAGLFMTYGQPFTPAEVGQVQPSSAAEQGGIKAGDLIVGIDGRDIERFEDVQQLVRLNPGVPMAIVVKRDGQPVSLNVTPQQHRGHRSLRRPASDRPAWDRPQRHRVRAARSGHRGRPRRRRDLEPGRFDARRRWADHHGDPRHRRARRAAANCANFGRSRAERHVPGTFWLMAVLSINLGLINLFPVPVLDGGHLAVLCR